MKSTLKSACRIATMIMPAVLLPLVRPALADSSKPVLAASYKKTELRTAAPKLAAGIMREAIERYNADRQGLERFYDVGFSEEHLTRFETFDNEWMTRLKKMDFAALTRKDQIDYLLLRNYIDHAQHQLITQRTLGKETAPLLPFAEKVAEIERKRSRVDILDPEQSAKTLAAITSEVKKVRGEVVAESTKPTAGQIKASAKAARHAAQTVEEVKQTLGGWFAYYDGFRPNFGWWCRKPFETLNAALDDYSRFLRDQIANYKPDDDSVLVGDAIGRAALLDDLKSEMIAYTPEELIQIAERELAWCTDQMKLASKEMGKGDDWKAALEAVKEQHVSPGEQDELVAKTAREAIAFLDKNELVTIDPLCRETWRVQMLSAQEQKYLPFAAYGGQKVLVAYATDQMDYEARQMSMRANNSHFTRIVVPHELIPGHHLQGYMAERYARYRGLFSTPFLVEGWSLYWEMLLWDKNYARGPEDRIGMLFWRMHRCARIIVSLGFHLNKMTPPQMVDYLVDRVGHERAAATSEVRRYIGGSYAPLYQVGYMIGGLQLRALHKDLVGVGNGKLTERQFHDAVLHEGSIPVDMIRAALTDIPLQADYTPTWKFAGKL